MESEPWVIGGPAKTISSKENEDVQIVRTDTWQTIDDFGTCFYELGCNSLNQLWLNESN